VSKKKGKLADFLAEAEEVLNSMGKDLVKLGRGVKAGVIDHSVLNGVFRSAHTLKGMSGVFEREDMAALIHSLEDTLDMLRLGRVCLTYEVLDCVMDAHDLLGKILASKGGDDFSGAIAALGERLEASRRPRKDADAPAIDKELLGSLTEYEAHRLRENLRACNNVYIVNAAFPITSFDKGYARVTDLLKTDCEVIATLPSGKSNPEFLHFDIIIGTEKPPEYITALLGDVAETGLRVLSRPARPPEVSGSLKGPALEVIRDRSRTPQAHQTLKRVSNTVRVDIAKLDSVMHIISELGILKSNLTRLGAELRGERTFSAYGLELSRAEKFLERKLAELRDGVLDIRMVPIGQLFGRFDALVDRLARDSGKEISVETSGEDTELDKRIIEELADPMMHIIRNIVDHAIEPPEVRESSGKPRAGTITLRAYQKSNHVVVEVADDGAGMDVEVIKAKAAERGLVTGDYLSTLSRRDALDLIFLPGFSTRDEVSVTSGRGVGMDVVKENITRLSGIIDIETEKGEGTRFILTIPVTLAIIQSIIVEAGAERYAVPLNSVIEIIEMTGEAAMAAERDGSIALGERVVPAVRLSTFFGAAPAAAPARSAEPAPGYGIIAGVAEHRTCMIVDRLVEELDVVIKPLSRIIRVPGIAGATDMGEKGTVLVLDVTGILDAAMEEKASAVQNS